MKSMSVVREYIERNGMTLEIELYYDLGKTSFYGSSPKRGYYARVIPVTLKTSIDSEGIEYTVKTVTAFSGTTMLIHPVSRKSKVAEEKAKNLFTNEIKEELINHVINKKEQF